MLYTVHSIIDDHYCVFDPSLNLVSRWNSDVTKATLDDSYSLSGHWASIYKLLHDELIKYFDEHPTLRLIDAPSTNSTYEYW